MTNNESIFDMIERRMIINEMKNAFEKKKLPVRQVILKDSDMSRMTIEVLTKDGNKILVEQVEKKFHWKLNALDMGEVFGNQIYDVAGSYECEKVKDKRVY